MKAGQYLMVSLLVFLLALVAGCDQVIDILGLGEEATEASAASSVCTQAIACCEELDKTSILDDVEQGFEATQGGEQSGWPNHCPSWKVRQDRECQELLDQTREMSAALKNEHPTFDYEEHCTAP